MKLFKLQQKSLGGDDDIPKERTEYKKSELEASSELIIFFIGISIMILGTINTIRPVPKEFLLGATLAGLFFAFSDYYLLKSKFFKTDLIINLTMVFLGVFCFFLLPVILITFPSLFNVFGQFGDIATFVALGLVVTGLGLKTYSSKRNFLLETKVDLLKLRQKNENFAKI
ncbi:hypothetical protein AB9M92_07505 [Peribacillus frigoritolerans]|uniref:hypothetical protein n=1 Tax=Peribacillus frigoritolerans TaxID=450367 RepID=UPI0035136BA6